MIAKSENIRSDLRRLDSHVIQPDEYDELPELTDDFFEKASVYEGTQLLQRRRPKSSSRKVKNPTPKGGGL